MALITIGSGILFISVRTLLCTSSRLNLPGGACPLPHWESFLFADLLLTILNVLN